MDTTLVRSHGEPAGPVRWEPCAQERPDETGPLCSVCGWPVEDHPAGTPAARAA